MPFPFSPQEVSTLRALAAQVAELAARPIEDEKRRLWTAHNDLKTSQPLVFIDPENGWNEIIPPASLVCGDPTARGFEWHLRREIHWGTVLKDDKVIDAVLPVGYVTTDSGYGVELRHVGGENGGAWKAVAPIKDYEKDFGKLKLPELSYDREKSAELKADAEELFGGILRVEQKASWWWTLGMTQDYINLRGFEDFLCDFLDEPEWMHRMMEFLSAALVRRIQFYRENGLLRQNTGNDYVGSGGFGFTEDLKPVPAGRVTPKDMWCLIESQETVSVSPEHYGEFIFPYHMRMAELFGQVCYGCCEPYEPRWKYAKTLPGLRRVSCSPWSDRTKTEEYLGGNYIASLKISPSSLALAHMNEDVVRRDIREALAGARNCVPELVMKDNNTLGGNPWNAERWVQICREEIDRIYG